MSYAYYTLLRFVLACICVFLMFGAELTLQPWQRWALGAFTVLYNPLIPIRLGDKDVWTAANIGTVVLLWIVATMTTPSSQKTPTVPIVHVERSPSIENERTSPKWRSIA